MPGSNPTHRRILRATSITGGASAASILIGIVRVKILAVLLGPAGVGIAGLYGTIMGTVSGLVGLGLRNSGVRQIAAAAGAGDEEAVGLVRKTLWRVSLVLGALGMGALWQFREPVSLWVFGDVEHSASVGWLGLGVFLSVVAGSQTALLQGLSRIGDLALIGVAGSALGSAASVACVYALGEDGIIYYVLVNPMASVLLAWYFASRLPRARCTAGWSASVHQVRALFGLGLVLMITGLMQNLTGLIVRSWVARDLGVEATGLFQAAWSISMQYIGFVLTAMGTDYYPRLTANIGSRSLSNTLVNDQAEVAMLLAGPVLLGLLAFSPLVIELLFTADFGQAAEILRWQVLGDVVKVFSWPIGFILLAKSQGKMFFFTQLSWHLVYLSAVWLGLPLMGVTATGVAFLCAYVVVFSLNLAIVKKLNGFRWTVGNRRLLFALPMAAGSIYVAGVLSDTLAYVLGLVLTVSFGLYSFRRLSR